MTLELTFTSKLHIFHTLPETEVENFFMDRLMFLPSSINQSPPRRHEVKIETAPSSTNKSIQMDNLSVSRGELSDVYKGLLRQGL
jgi:hypothetical protein